MNGAAFFSQSPILEPLGWTLIHFLWQGAALALLLALAFAGLKSASAQSRYLAGCLAMLLMGLAPLITIRYEIQSTKPVSLANFPQPIEKASVLNDSSRGVQPVGEVISINGKAILAAKTSRTFAGRLIPWFVVSWCFGVFFLSVRLFASWFRVQIWKHSHRETLDSAWLAKLDELQTKLGIRKKIALLKSSFLETPAVIGWLRPVILVPASALSGLSPAQLEAILIHELSHIRRHDYLVNLLQSAIETLLFYHPAVWWVSRKIRQERENCCDDIAVQLCGDRCNYARALTTLEHLRRDTPSLALAADGGLIGTRVRRILGVGNTARFNPTWVGGALGLMALAVLLYVSRVILFANEPQTPTPSTPLTNDLKVIAQPIQASGADKISVVQDYPIDWKLVRANLRNFISNTNATLAVQLHEYFASRGINVTLENNSEENAKTVESDAISIPSQIDEAIGTLKVRVTHGKMARFEDPLRRLSAPFNQILIEVKWSELHDGNAPTNRLRLLPQLFADDGAAFSEPQNHSNLITKPCLGSALAIQVIGNNKRQTNNIATKEIQPFSVILSQAQLTNLIQTLEQRAGVDILTAPRVTALSGRQARVSVEDTLTIITGLETNSVGKSSPIATDMQFGPVAEIFPELSSDRSEIQLKVIGRLREFVGYWKPNSKGMFEPVPVPQGKSNEPLPNPRLRERYYEATESVRTGETILMGGLTIETQVINIDEIPVLRDIPLLGRLFRKESTAKQWVSLFLIVTPTVVNSYGDKARTD